MRVCENTGIEVADLIQGLVEAGVGGMVRNELPPWHIHSVKGPMMPALAPVSAVTTQSRELYAVEGIPVWEDTRVLEQMERTTAEDGNAAD